MLGGLWRAVWTVDVKMWFDLAKSEALRCSENPGFRMNNYEQGLWRIDHPILLQNAFQDLTVQ